MSEIQIRERKDGHSSDISPVPVSSSVDDRSGKPEETMIERENSLNSQIPEWLQEFREILVDDEIPLQRRSHASSSHEASLEPITKRREDLGKHSVSTHFLKDRNCEICQRDKNYCSRGAGLSHSMDPSVSVQNKNVTGNTEAFKSSSSREES